MLIIGYNRGVVIYTPPLINCQTEGSGEAVGEAALQWYGGVSLCFSGAKKGVDKGEYW